MTFDKSLIYLDNVDCAGQTQVISDPLKTKARLGDGYPVNIYIAPSAAISTAAEATVKVTLQTRKAGATAWDTLLSTDAVKTAQVGGAGAFLLPAGYLFALNFVPAHMLDESRLVVDFSAAPTAGHMFAAIVKDNVSTEAPKLGI